MILQLKYLALEALLPELLWDNAAELWHTFDVVEIGMLINHFSFKIMISSHKAISMCYSESLNRYALRVYLRSYKTYRLHNHHSIDSDTDGLVDLFLQYHKERTAYPRSKWSFNFITFAMYPEGELVSMIKQAVTSAKRYKDDQNDLLQNVQADIRPKNQAKKYENHKGQQDLKRSIKTSIILGHKAMSKCQYSRGKHR